MAQSIFDKICFEILAQLYDNREGLRFKDFKNSITASDPVISNRLSLLKKHVLVEVSPVIDEESESKYFVYRITEEGSDFVGRHEIRDLLDDIRRLDTRRRSK